MMKLDSRLFDLKISWPCRTVKAFLFQSRSTTAGLRFLFWFDEKVKPRRPTGWLIEFDELDAEMFNHGWAVVFLLMKRRSRNLFVTHHQCA